MTTDIQEKILHGTTTVGIKASDGVVLCADMRASAGYFIANNNTMKIQKIYDHAGLTLAGGVADAQNLTDILRYHANIHSCKHTLHSKKSKHSDKISSKTLFSRFPSKQRLSVYS